MSDFLLLFGASSAAAAEDILQIEFGTVVAPRGGATFNELASGEVQLVETGQKTSLKEFLLRTYADPTGTPPALVIMARGSDSDVWFGPGDRNGTFVGTSGACVGTGTAWSHTIAVANGSDQAFTVPCAATKARMYLDGVATTAFMVTALHEITFTSVPATGVIVTCYWSGYPFVIAKVGDMVQFADGTFFRITAIADATHMTATDGTGVGTHWTSYLAPNGEGEVRAALTGILDTMQFRILAFPAETGGVVNFKPLSAVAVHVPSQERQYREA